MNTPATHTDTDYAAQLAAALIQAQADADADTTGEEAIDAAEANSLGRLSGLLHAASLLAGDRFDARVDSDMPRRDARAIAARVRASAGEPDPVEYVARYIRPVS